MNCVALVGRLTKDPELRTTQSGLSYCQFTLAVDRRVSKESQTQQTADFIGCVAWRQSADYLSNYGQKGSVVALEGKIQTRNYDDRDGKKVYVTEVLADRLSLISTKKSSGSSKSDYPSGGTSISRDDISKAVAAADPIDLAEGFDTGIDADINPDDLPF